jgi:hypothetical protein
MQPINARRSGQRSDFIRQFDRLAEVGGGLLEGRAAQGLVTGLPPPLDRRLVEPGLG